MPVFPRAETPEVFRGFGTGVLEKLHLDAPRRRPSDGHIEEHNRVSSCDRLFCRKMDSSAVVRRERKKRAEVNVTFACDQRVRPGAALSRERVSYQQKTKQRAPAAVCLPHTYLADNLPMSHVEKKEGGDG